MLSESERQTLLEIQRRFLAEDPDFARSFLPVTQPLPRDHPRWAYTLAIVLAAILSLLMLTAGLPGDALVFGAVAGLVWVARRRRDDTCQRQIDGPPTPG